MGLALTSMMALLPMSFFRVPIGASALKKEESKGLKIFEGLVDVSCNGARSLYRFLSCIGAHPSRWELHNVCEVKEHGFVPLYIIENHLFHTLILPIM